MRKTLMIATVALAGLVCSFANAAEYEVKMLNKGEKGGMVFEPDFVKAAPGDTIIFLPSDKGHNAESIKGMIPEGAEKFKSNFNKEFVFAVEKGGLYGIKFTPHYGLGM